MNTFKKGKKLVSLEEAKALIEQWILPLEHFAEKIDSVASIGRVLAEDLYADEDFPSFRKSTMDGYALCLEANQMESSYQLIGESAMGSSQVLQMRKGTAVYVTTGGKLPEAANAVAKVEGTRLEGDQLLIVNAADIGTHWIEKGEDIKRNQLALSRGRRINPMALGFLSLLGMDKICVRKWLKVAIITTGDELVPSFMEAEDGKIRDINQIVLKELAKRMDCDVIFTRLVKDELELVEEALLEGVQAADLVITSGASSMGKADVIPELMQKHSDSGLIFHGLNIKPGKPVGLALIGGKPVLALPGNPVSSAMTFVAIGEFLMGRLTGQCLERIVVNGILEESCASQEGKTTFIPVQLETRDGNCYANPIFGKSGLISIIAISDGFIVIDPDERLESGARVNITLF